MARRLFTLASAASLVLFVAVCLLWSWSQWRFGFVEGVSRHRLDRDSRFVERESSWSLSAYDDGIEYRGVWSESSRPSLGGSVPLGERTYGRGSYPVALREVWWLSWEHHRAVALDGLLGFWWASHGLKDPFGYARSVRASVPYWALCLLTASAPASWLASRILRRHRRARSGLCPSCGYDLRATPDRCPECGAAAGGKGDGGRAAR